MEFFTVPGPWSWLALGLVLLAAEVMTGTTYLLWLAVAAAAMAAVTALVGDLSIPMQLVIYGGLALAATISGRRMFPPDERSSISASNELNRPDSRMLGQQVEAIGDFSGNSGRVRFGDTEWRAEIVGEAGVAAGAKLEVVAVDGATLRVKVQHEAMISRQT
jgi:inner membrane protein